MCPAFLFYIKLNEIYWNRFIRFIATKTSTNGYLKECLKEDNCFGIMKPLSCLQTNSLFASNFLKVKDLHKLDGQLLKAVKI